VVPALELQRQDRVDAILAKHFSDPERRLAAEPMGLQLSELVDLGRNGDLAGVLFRDAPGSGMVAAIAARDWDLDVRIRHV
jgi:hypothetical protein